MGWGLPPHGSTPYDRLLCKIYVIVIFLFFPQLKRKEEPNCQRRKKTLKQQQ
jgi:hypothetical protein